jgi:DNA (cytosine-5)-methyltransferase 1
MRILDLYCKAGGVSVGLHRRYPHAQIVGVDIEPQPRYPFVFVQADALTFDLHGYDFIWASPPCQAFTQVTARYRGGGGKADTHLDLLTPTRERLLQQSAPWIIENVVGAKRVMREPVLLHGGMFGLGVYRPRLFESSFPIFTIPAKAPSNAIGVYGKLDGRRLWTRADGTEQRAPRTLAQANAAMGIDWMEWDELKEAIPPAYSHYLAQFIPTPKTLRIAA